MDKKTKTADTKDKSISLAPLDFEQALENLLQVKPERKTCQRKRASRKLKNSFATLI
jgi:hypothetical protein